MLTRRSFLAAASAALGLAVVAPVLPVLEPAAPTVATVSDWDALLKKYYTQKRVEDLVFKNKPLFAMLPRMK